ncbi:MAG: N-acetyltransferase [Planctomycetes bacterium]|nr:N-acetyltransferase [Planctomycetota bacterium]
MRAPPPEETLVRAATGADAEALARIYNHYVANTIVTFEEELVPPGEMARRIAATAAEALPWLVAECGEEVVGFALASKWKGRCAYRFSVEITVYADHAWTRRGIGSHLYGRLLPDLRGRGMHSAIGGIALPNPASVALHEKFGLRKVAHFREVGFKLGRWIDVGYWQVTLQPVDSAARPATRAP